MDKVSVEDLIKKSREALEFAYCPYSKFRVGAAIVAKDGTVFTGCNIENVSYPLSVCAERTAILKAVSEGHQDFVAMAVSTDMPDTFSSPCGACRQCMLEFSLDMPVYMSKPDMTYLKLTPSELLPHGFTPKTLLDHQTQHQDQ